jgi:hypothetical protein
MKKIIKIVFIVLSIAAVIIQLIPNNLPEVKQDNPNDLLLAGSVNDEVTIILKTACYDCHSNQTRLPWYAYVAPVSWLVSKDVNKGRKELNFSEWTTYPKRRLLKKLEEMGEEVDEEKMPLPIYTVIHGDAKLSAEQRRLLVEWTQQETKRILGN